MTPLDTGLIQDALSRAPLTGLVAAGVLMTISGAVHLRSSKPLLASLLSHGLLPYHLARRLASKVAVAQLAAVLGGLVAFGSGSEQMIAAVSLATALLFGSMTAYLTLVLLNKPSATCNCFGVEQPITWLTTTRAAVLALSALVVCVSSQPAPSGAELMVIAGCGVALSGLLVWLPAHLGARPGEPARDRQQLGSKEFKWPAGLPREPRTTLSE